MDFINMNNNFTAFGSFAVFDEDNIAIINRLYGDCNISINQEPNNPTNKSGKVMQIVDNKRHFTIILRPNRLDVQIAGTPRNNSNQVLKLATDLFKALGEMFDGCLATRIAYVSNDFVFDDYGDNMQKIAKEISFLKDNKVNEFSLRTNTISQVLDEDVNVVLNINNVKIGKNNEPQMGQRLALMIVYDINTLLDNDHQRFDLRNLLPYFSLMYDISTSRLETFKKMA